MAEFALAKELTIYEAPKVRRPMTTAPLLYYPNDALPLRTPFRDSVVQMIYEFGQAELGDTLQSVTISTWQSYNEPDSPILLVTFWTHSDKPERLRVDKAISELVAEMSASWSDIEKKDYGETIYFGVEPIDV